MLDGHDITGAYEWRYGAPKPCAITGHDRDHAPPKKVRPMP